MNDFEPLKKMTVLFVDDDAEVRTRLGAVLQYYFGRVFLASDGAEALEMYRNHTCHLLLVDYEMPVMDGCAFLQEVRKDDDRTPAGILSSYEETQKLRNAIRLNLVDYLIKPCDIDQLELFLRACLAWMDKRGNLRFRLSETHAYSMVDKTLVIGEEKILLTLYESIAMETLIHRNERLVTYQCLIAALGGETTLKSLFTIVYKLKKKLGIDVIKNVKDLGYILKVAP